MLSFSVRLVLCYVMLCCVMLCSVVFVEGALFCYVVLCRLMLCHVLLWMFCDGLFCSVMFCHARVLFCHALLCDVVFCLFLVVMLVEGARRETRDTRGHSGQLGVWRPRYAGWGWPGGLFLKSNNPNLSGGESMIVASRGTPGGPSWASWGLF